jgi:hypothetical protein
LDIDPIAFGIEDQGPDKEPELVLDPSEFEFLPCASTAGDDGEVEVVGDGGVDLPDLELPDVVALVEGAHGWGGQQGFDRVAEFGEDFYAGRLLHSYAILENGYVRIIGRFRKWGWGVIKYSGNNGLKQKTIAFPPYLAISLFFSIISLLLPIPFPHIITATIQTPNGHLNSFPAPLVMSG